MSAAAAGLVPVHVGQSEPGSEQEMRRSSRRQLPRLPSGLDWQRHGLQPQWLGMDASDCVVALEPGFFQGQGAEERERFFAGARRRDELALVVALLGKADHDSPRSVLSTYDTSVQLGTRYTRVVGRRLPTGTRPEIAPDLSRADRDLAIRLLTRPVDAPWWSIRLSGTQLVRGDGSGSVTHGAQGELRPILVDAFGDPVVAAWVSPSGDQRWYLIPDVTDWDNVLGWLAQRALPEYVPNALRRVRSPHFVDPDLQTTEEVAARQALDELDARYAKERSDLERSLSEAEARAEPIRHGLLYGAGAELVDAVARVLVAAGLHAIDLEGEFGATSSADLLVSTGRPPRRLLDVKAAGGPAQEELVAQLLTHLDSWPQLCPDQPVAGGVLVVNHQHKLHPSKRSPHVYSRPEFVAALPVTVLSTIEIFHWWRVADWPAIRAAVVGVETVPAIANETPLAADRSAATAQGRRRRWRPGARTP